MSVEKEKVERRATRKRHKLLSPPLPLSSMKVLDLERNEGKWNELDYFIQGKEERGEGYEFSQSSGRGEIFPPTTTLRPLAHYY